MAHAPGQSKRRAAVVTEVRPSAPRRKSTDVRHPPSDLRQALLVELEAAGLTVPQLRRAAELGDEDLLELVTSTR